jgi:CAAX protease family protein
VGFIALGVATVVGFVLIRVFGTGDSDGLPAVVFAIANLVQELALLVTVLLWVRFVSHGPLAALGRPRTPWRDAALGIGSGLALILAGGMALVVIRVLVSLLIGHPPSTPEQIPSNVTGWPFALSGVTVVLVAPLAEETFFRGFLYKGLRRRFSVWPAALVSSFFFGLVHIYPLLIPALFVVGLGLALIYEYRQSLLASMAAHATFNLIGFITIALARH